MAGKFKFNFDKKAEEIKNAEKGGADERFFKLTLGKEESVSAIIRFLPDQDGNPYVKFYDHSFDYDTPDNVKKRYWKNCINTFGYDKKCPVCEKNMIYYNSVFEKDKKIAQARSRNLYYVSNIYVIKNAHAPETEGKVFLFKYGKSIFEKIKKHWFPKDADLQDPEFKQFIPFDLYDGADFFLKVEKQGVFANGTPIPKYDGSKFLTPSPFLKGKDSDIEKVIDQTHKIEEFIAPDKFPSNEEVIKVLGHLLGIDPAGISVQHDSNPENQPLDDDSQQHDDTPPFDMGDDDIPNFPTPVEEKKELEPTPEAKKEEPEQDDDDDSFFDQFK